MADADHVGGDGAAIVMGAKMFFVWEYFGDISVVTVEVTGVTPKGAMIRLQGGGMLRVLAHGLFGERASAQAWLDERVNAESLRKGGA